MNKNKNANQPALPLEVVNEAGSRWTGLSKREEFAKFMMSSLGNSNGYKTWENMAQDAVAMADALLAELEKEQS